MVHFLWYKFSKRPDMRMAHIGGVAGHFLKDLIDQSGLSLENVHVIGFSYGGQVPQERYQLDTLIDVFFRLAPICARSSKS